MTTREGQPIYEVRGFTQEGGSNLYIGIVTDLPKGMPIGTSVNEDARLVGYFFKLQGYISQQQQLEAERTRKRPVTLKAPVIIGRLIWTVSPAGSRGEDPLLATGDDRLRGRGGHRRMGIAGHAKIRGGVSCRPSFPAPASIPKAPSVDNWLDQAQSGRLSLEPVPETTARGDGAALDGGFGDRLSGNIFRGNDESNNGHSANGNGNMGPAGNSAEQGNRPNEIKIQSKR